MFPTLLGTSIPPDLRLNMPSFWLTAALFLMPACLLVLQRPVRPRMKVLILRLAPFCGVFWLYALLLSPLRDWFAGGHFSVKRAYFHIGVAVITTMAFGAAFSFSAMRCPDKPARIIGAILGPLFAVALMAIGCLLALMYHTNRTDTP
jgi:hypothetical protein